MTKTIGTLAQAAILIPFLGATFSLPCQEILQQEKIIPDHCTCMMDGGHCNCPFCLAHHITNMKGCRNMCCCGLSRPTAQETRPTTEAMAFFFTNPGRAVSCLRRIVLRQLPGSPATLPEGAVTRLTKPPRSSSLLG